MFGFKRRRLQRDLPPITAKNEHELACALLDGFRGRSGTQQVCLYCDARGGFEMRHHPNCIVGAAADRLFYLATYDHRKRRYLTLEENRAENILLKSKLQRTCSHTGREHRHDGWWCPECHALGPVPCVATPY